MVRGETRRMVIARIRGFPYLFQPCSWPVLDGSVVQRSESYTNFVKQKKINSDCSARNVWEGFKGERARRKPADFESPGYDLESAGLRRAARLFDSYIVLRPHLY